VDTIGGNGSHGDSFQALRSSIPKLCLEIGARNVGSILDPRSFRFVRKGRRG